VRTAGEREQGARLEAQAINRMKDEFPHPPTSSVRAERHPPGGRTLEVGNRDDASVERATRTSKNKRSSCSLSSSRPSWIVPNHRGATQSPSGAEVSLRTVIEARSKPCNRPADAKAIVIDTGVSPEARNIIAVCGIAQQVMSNLLSNAISSSRRKRPALR